MNKKVILAVMNTTSAVVTHFWKLYDALIVPILLTFMSDFVYLYITKKVCMR